MCVSGNIVTNKHWAYNYYHCHKIPLMVRVIMIMCSVCPGNLATTEHWAGQERRSPCRDEVPLISLFSSKYDFKRSSGQNDRNGSKMTSLCICWFRGLIEDLLAECLQELGYPKDLSTYKVSVPYPDHCIIFNFREMRTWSPSLRKFERFSAMGQMNRWSTL